AGNHLLIGERKHLRLVLSGAHFLRPASRSPATRPIPGKAHPVWKSNVNIMKFQKDCKITLTNFVLRLNKRNFNAFYSFLGKAILYRKNGFCNISNGYMTATTSIAILLGQLQNES